jgi:hypothetical protein
MTAPASLPDDLEAVLTVVDALKAFPADEQRRILRWAQEKLGLPQIPPHAPPATPITTPAEPGAHISSPPGACP